MSQCHSTNFNPTKVPQNLPRKQQLDLRTRRRRASHTNRPTPKHDPNNSTLHEALPQRILKRRIQRTSLQHSQTAPGIPRHRASPCSATTPRNYTPKHKHGLQDPERFGELARTSWSSQKNGGMAFESLASGSEFVDYDDH